MRGIVLRLPSVPIAVIILFYLFQVILFYLFQVI